MPANHGICPVQHTHPLTTWRVTHPSPVKLLTQAPLLPQAPPSTISDSEWYKQQGGKLTLLDYSADRIKVRLLPPLSSPFP